MRTKNQNISKKIVYGVTVGDSAFALLRGQLRWFHERGWDVILVTAPGRLADIAVKREGVRLVELRMKRPISLIADVKALCKWVLVLRRERPDCVNVGTPKAGLLGGLAAWMTRVPRRIYVVRGLRLESTTGPLKVLLWLMEKVSLWAATDVVAVSNSLAQELISYKLVSSSKIWLIGQGSSNGVDTNAIRARTSIVDRDDLRKDLGIPSEYCLIGYIGRLSRDKGIDTLLRAMSSLPSSSKIGLLCVGDIEDDTLRKEIQDFEHMIQVVPWTPDVWGLLPAIDVLCLPTRREGFPNVILEAASAGIPALSTRVTGAVDAVVPEETGILVEFGDVRELADAILRISADPEMRRRLGSAAQSRAENDFQPLSVWHGLEAIMSGNASDGCMSSPSPLRKDYVP